MSLIERSLPIIGESGATKLNNAKVIVEKTNITYDALVRSGIGAVTVVDGDVVSETNRNRQLIALCSTIDKEKALTCAERLRDINPECDVKSLNLFYSAETADAIDLSEYDFVADCIDTVTSKLLLIAKSKESNVPIISSMGTGNRLNPADIIVTDVFKTSGDPLARVMRKELRARNIESLKVICSTEEPSECVEGRNAITGRATPSSSCYVPATAGIRMAYEIVMEIING